MKNVHFGAGNIGRGFIGFLLTKSGYDVTFVDVNEEVVNAINEKKHYRVIQLDGKDTTDIVQNISSINSLSEEKKLIQELANSDLVTTAMGINNLKFIEKFLVKMIDFRIENNITNYLNIICCENGIRVTSQFKKSLFKRLTSSQKEHCFKTIAFVDAGVDRIIPNQTNQNILDVKVEPYFEWVVDANQIMGELYIKNLEVSDNLDYFNQRKLLTVNAGHAAISYVGYENDYEFIFDAINDEKIKKLVFDFLSEISNALSYTFKFDKEEHIVYINKTLDRFSNKLLIDDIKRVARNPITKLGEAERLVRPLNILIENGDQNYINILKVINATLSYDDASDPEAVLLDQKIKNSSRKEVFEELSSISCPKVLSLINV